MIPVACGVDLTGINMSKLTTVAVVLVACAIAFVGVELHRYTDAQLAIADEAWQHQQVMDSIQYPWHQKLYAQSASAKTVATARMQHFGLE
jgi:hypothetical protein